MRKHHHESGIHFGHYIVGCKSEIILHYHAARVTVVIAHAIQLEWCVGTLPEGKYVMHPYLESLEYRVPSQEYRYT
jgi:hypothetical protein